MTITIPAAIFPATPGSSVLEKAQKLASELGLSLVTNMDAGPAYLLCLTEDRLELRANPAYTSLQPFSPIYVDFLGGASGYRHAHNTTTKQPLARAVGIRPGFRPTIIDATAGLGGDGFVLACLGCRVHLLERSPVLFALLRDGLQRAERDARTSAIIGDRIRLTRADGITALGALDEPAHTIYLDPMYPHSAKSALNKKEMRVIRDLVGDDLDGRELLARALMTATNRVVVKRPKGAEHLAEQKPSHEIFMKNSRFDVYLIAHL